MLVNGIICYVIFMINLTTSIANGQDDKKELENESKQHVISKRETILLFDTFPHEPIYKPRPQKVQYRRVSSPKLSPKPKYGPPRSKYRAAKPPRKPIHKYKKPVGKYGPPSSRKRPSKPRYGPPKKSPKPVYGAPKKKHHTYYPPEPVGFGEPPLDYFYNPRQSFGEPPTDFSPSKSNYDPYQAAQDFINPNIFDEENSKFGQDFKHWNIDQDDQDTSYAYTHKQPLYTKPEPSFDPSAPDDDDFNSYIDRYKFRDFEEETNVYPRKIKPYYSDNAQAKRGRKPPKSRIEDEVLVGGQYAEPPARIVHKSYQSDSPFFDDDFSPALGYIDPEIAVSATISPYVNYKNSNMAFSPQNLNDAFSIVDK